MILILTVFTQVGGIIYVLNLVLIKKYSLNAVKAITSFFLIYLLSNFLLLPLIAPVFGRVSLPLTGELRPLNLMTCLLNRHYVRPEMRSQLIAISGEMSVLFEGTHTNYLDANFPFINGFPLFPHLSHNDGRKLDLAFYYEKQGEKDDLSPSFSGYGVYEDPDTHEISYADFCAKEGYWQYGLLEYVTPQWNKDSYELDVERTKKLILLLAENESTSKIFIEPHLKERWGLEKQDNIRFHGCQAVRHDDHIHYQIK
ncbi:MAG: hypothetical protein JXR03_06075 [Cyclobacteriaceae bacterium]